MRYTWKEALATALTGLVVFTFLATHEGWDVPLVGDSHTWAAAVITMLGAVSWGLGSAHHLAEHKLASALGALALVLATLALITAR